MELQLPQVDLLRAAIVAREWKRAERLLTEFRVAVEAIWDGLQTDEERRRLRDEVLATLQWARMMALAGRGQARDNLIQLTRRGAYLEIQHSVTNIQIEV